MYHVEDEANSERAAGMLPLHPKETAKQDSHHLIYNLSADHIIEIRVLFSGTFFANSVLEKLD